MQSTHHAAWQKNEKKFQKSKSWNEKQNKHMIEQYSNSIARYFGSLSALTSLGSTFSTCSISTTDWPQMRAWLQDLAAASTIKSWTTSPTSRTVSSPILVLPSLNCCLTICFTASWGKTKKRLVRERLSRHSGKVLRERHLPCTLSKQQRQS